MKKQMKLEKKDKRQDEFKDTFQEMSPKQSFIDRMISMVKPKKSTLGGKKNNLEKKGSLHLEEK